MEEGPRKDSKDARAAGSALGVAAHLVGDEVLRGLWDGARRWFTLSFCLGAALLGVLFFILPDDGEPAGVSSTIVFVLVLALISIGVLGLEISELRERRREKRERRRGR